MRKYSLSCPGPNKSSRSLVPRPIICQNLILDRTFLKNTKLTTSGTSIPVSNMSTDTAICGSESSTLRSEERRVGKECRSNRSEGHKKTIAEIDKSGGDNQNI